MNYSFETKLKGDLIQVFKKLVKRLDSYNAVVSGRYPSDLDLDWDCRDGDVIATEWYNIVSKNGIVEHRPGEDSELYMSSQTVIAEATRRLGNKQIKITCKVNKISVKDDFGNQDMTFFKKGHGWSVKISPRGLNLPVLFSASFSLEHLITHHQLMRGHVHANGRNVTFKAYVTDRCNMNIEAVPADLRSNFESLFERLNDDAALVKEWPRLKGMRF